MLGKHHTKEMCDKTRERMKKEWKNPNSVFNTDEFRQKHSDYMHKMMMENRNSITNYSRAKSGKRADLNNLYVRSSWEANYARYLNFLLEHGKLYKWEYEPDVFDFEKIKRGIRSYTPDFKVWETSESEPYYVEIKGWMDDKSRTKLKRMAKYYPNIKIKLIQQKEYDEIKKNVAPFIRNWEY